MSRHERVSNTITRRTVAKQPSIREQYLDRAVSVLHHYIKVELGATIAEFAMGFDVSESTLRHFLERQHKRSPYPSTLKEIARAPRLPTHVREALLDVIDFENRVIARLR